MVPSSRRVRLFGVLLVCGMIAVIHPVGAQSNDTLDRVLAESELSWGSAAWLALRATDRIPDATTPAEALARLETLGFGVAHHPPTDVISLGEYAHLLMQLFELDGGIL